MHETSCILPPDAKLNVIYWIVTALSELTVKIVSAAVLIVNDIVPLLEVSPCIVVCFVMVACTSAKTGLADNWIVLPEL